MHLKITSPDSQTINYVKIRAKILPNHIISAQHSNQCFLAGLWSVQKWHHWWL